MNENPEGTPNPLNPSPMAGEGATGVAGAETGAAGATPDASGAGAGAGGAAPGVASIAEPATMGRVTTTAQPIVVAAAQPAAPVAIQADAAAAQVSAGEAGASAPGVSTPEAGNGLLGARQGAESESARVVPTAAQPEVMESNMNGSVVEPVGRKRPRAGLIIAVVLIVLALCCGVAAAVAMLMRQSGDRVTAAIEKILSGEVPSNVAVAGNITVTTDSAYGVLAEANVGLDAQLDLANGSNVMTAAVTASLLDGTQMDMNISEVQVAGGDLFLKLDNVNGVGGELEDANTNCIDDTNCIEGVVEEEDCTESEDGTLECVVTGSGYTSGGATMAMLGMLDGEWIRIPASLLTGAGGTGMLGSTVGLTDGQPACMVDALMSLPAYGKSLAASYRENPFVVASTDNLGIKQKVNHLYRISFDGDKLANFIDSISNSRFVNDLNACVNTAAIIDGSSSVEAVAEVMASGTGSLKAEIEAMFANFPTLYVEVNDNDEFTRMYFAMGEGGYAMTADLALSYPANLEIAEPGEYIDLTSLLPLLVMGDVDLGIDDEWLDGYEGETLDWGDYDDDELDDYHEEEYYYEDGDYYEYLEDAIWDSEFEYLVE